MADLQLKLGQTVQTNEGRQGIIRYVGGLHITPGNWLGLELPDASGKNDGSVQGQRYFTCRPGYGIFVREEAVVETMKQAAPATAPKANGNATAPGASTRPRPGSGLSADVARRRQSLMSSGSGSATASRLSMRSPTKSPVKPTSTSASSTTPAPRTVTPSIAVRPPATSTKPRPSIAGRPSVGPSNGNVRPSAHASRPSIGSASSVRGTTAPTARPTAPPTRPSTLTTRLSQQSKTAPRQDRPTSKPSPKPEPERRNEHVQSPTIDEEAEEDGDREEMPNIGTTLDQSSLAEKQEPMSDQAPVSPVASSSTTRQVSMSRTGTVANIESRAAQQREVEQLKAKIRTLEKKRQEDRDRLKEVEALEGEKERFASIIKALRDKIRTNQQDLSEARSRYEEAEARANAIPDRSGELESELELATLDKEMAEERAETYQMDLEALKAKHEELELEVEILREENAELASTMSPEEKASAGWLQMERERERLRDALLQLRDMSQENESNLRAEIEELRENLDEVEKTAGMYNGAAEKLSRAEETNKHLVGQLEAIESNDEVVEAMEVQREQHLHLIEQLRNQIQDLEEHIQVTEELELFHVDEEKRLHMQIDDSEALLGESHRRSVEQDRVIEDLEYTLTKFRDVVQGLQSDIDELRRSRDISEMQADEMSSKSRAMMDLNLRLQNNAAKTQAKVIDTELDKLKSLLAEKHIDILSLFTPESFEVEKRPVSVLLCFGRIKSKAKLVGKMLGERLRERSHLSNGDEIFRTFETMEGVEWISESCHRFERYMHNCGTEQFGAYSVAFSELEPVERTINGWIDALRRDELANYEPEHLKRMVEILVDLSDKLMDDSIATKATEVILQAGMVENYAGSLTGQLTAIVKLVQTKLGAPTDDDEESLVFDKRMDQLVTKARTVKYLCNKVVQQLKDVSSSSICVKEASWSLFEEAEQVASQLTKQVRLVGFAVVEDFSKLDIEEPITYASIPNIMMAALRPLQSNGNSIDDPFAFFTLHLNSLQSLVDDLQDSTSDVNNAIEFESKTAPWIVRAKEIKSKKLVPPEIQEEITRLERRNTELGSKIVEREKTIEEMGMRVEIAEKRFKESKEKDNKDKALQDELAGLRSEKQSNDKTIIDLRAELTTALQTAETAQTDLETLRSTTNIDALTSSATTTGNTLGIINGKADESVITQFTIEANLLQAEINSLQAAIRYLRDENRTLRIPISEVLIHSARTSWLDSSIGIGTTTMTTQERARRIALEREGVDVYSGLIDVAKQAKPVRLAAATLKTQKPLTAESKWQPAAQTTRYAVLRQREELERWEAWREDLIKRAKIVSLEMRGGSAGVGTYRLKNKLGGMGLPRLDGSNLSGGGDRDGMKKVGDIEMVGRGLRGVRIVDS